MLAATKLTGSNSFLPCALDMFIEVKLTGLSLGAISLGCDPAMWATLQWGVHEEEMKKALCSTFSPSSSPSSLTDQISMAETHRHTLQLCS